MTFFVQWITNEGMKFVFIMNFFCPSWIKGIGVMMSIWMSMKRVVTLHYCLKKKLQHCLYFPQVQMNLKSLFFMPCQKDFLTIKAIPCVIQPQLQKETLINQLIMQI